MPLFTIGHSNHLLPKFIALLTANQITTLVDVRTAPYSRYSPHFNKSDLDASLPQHGVRYVFAGEFLGGRPSDPTCYKQRKLPADDADFLHEVDYPEIMTRDWFQRGIKRLLELADEGAAAIMCSEENPAECHRHHLITKYLLEHHPELEINHIRGDGTVFRAQSLLASVDDPNSEQLSFF